MGTYLVHVTVDGRAFRTSAGSASARSSILSGAPQPLPELEAPLYGAHTRRSLRCTYNDSVNFRRSDLNLSMTFEETPKVRFVLYGCVVESDTLRDVLPWSTLLQAKNISAGAPLPKDLHELEPVIALVHSETNTRGREASEEAREYPIVACARVKLEEEEGRSLDAYFVELTHIHS
eukprot:1185172-Prorocentrum_minimum.AAC.1